MDRIEEIRRRHRNRKQSTLTKSPAAFRPPSSHSSVEREPSRPQETKKKPYFFLMKCMVAAVLVLGVGVLQKETFYPLPKVKTELQSALNNEFNFAGVSSWYQQTFGQPLALLPLGKKGQSVQQTATNVNKANFVEPVSGQVTQTFSQSQKGVTVQTASNSPVEAIDSGYVLSISDDKKTGKTVVIQHTNGDQSIYGELQSVNIKVYDFVKKGQKIGQVSKEKNEGVFYFAYKKGNKYVDPIQVISFD
ncbi:M23 family metallopeptidase [Pullulanibacillus sp. KACC 23026]|uniref:M23 family metallopeptidase n=1 Tax=Pullulanibacillus sp. KACC 23026 TaxID=3028315 RepID=UPI0023B122E1|nr:M23 family metallopeptidase [Pullulanibacillus sp. KACC 23026]WEG14055.1 M23 family metallopeptidase [Pullulanibacillus sp. KACC 23026]